MCLLEVDLNELKGLWRSATIIVAPHVGACYRRSNSLEATAVAIQAIFFIDFRSSGLKQRRRSQLLVIIQVVRQLKEFMNKLSRSNYNIIHSPGGNGNAQR